jgi:hypothetical protein
VELTFNHVVFITTTKDPYGSTGGIWMKHSYADLFLKPDAFFQDLKSEKESLTVPALVILLTGMAAAAYAYLAAGLTAAMMAGIMPGMETIILLSSSAGALFFTFVFWIIWSGLIFALSLLFKGKGSFKKTMECVGYGFAPQIFGSLITLAAAFSYIPHVKVPALTAATIQDAQALQEATRALMHDPAMLALTQITSVVSIAFLLWSASIWIFGLKHARSISLQNAAICVGVPVVGYCIYILYMMTVM